MGSQSQPLPVILGAEMTRLQRHIHRWGLDPTLISAAPTFDSFPLKTLKQTAGQEQLHCYLEGAKGVN